MNKEKNKRFSILLSFIFIVSIIVFIVIVSNKNNYSNWITMEATIIDTWKESHIGYKGNNNVDYLTKFTYEIDGQTYTNEGCCINVNVLFGYDGTYYEKTAVGEKMEIYVNPDDYSDSILVANIPKTIDIWIIILVPIVLLGIIIIIISIFSKRKKKN